MTWHDPDDDERDDDGERCYVPADWAAQVAAVRAEVAAERLAAQRLASRPRSLTREERAEVRSLVEDSGYTRAEATALVRARVVCS